jgi:glycosyltransferase involved in cell wall biosynthesis
MARYCPAPYVVTVHDLAAMSLEAALTKKERYYLADARDAGRRASALIAVSASSGGEIERFFGRRDYEIIHASPDMERFRPASPAAIAELRAEYNLPPYILCVGTLQARKNQLRLIDAFESIAHRIPHTLVLVGRDGSGADEVHGRLAQHPNPRIRLLGFFPEKQLSALYSGAEAVVFPSLWEGFGLPILEAMVCDTPVLTSNISSLAEVAGDAALTVDPRSTEDIADKLYCLLTDENLRESLRQRGRMRAKKFSWPESARRIAAVYRRTAERGQRRKKAP